MIRSRHSWLSCLASMLVLVLGAASTSTIFAQDAIVDVHRDLKPILESRCFRCHGGEQTEGMDLNDSSWIDDYIVANEPGDSDFFQRLIADDDSIMPPLGEGGPLAGSEIATIKLWIEEGAEWPEGLQLGVEGEEPAVATEPQLPAGFVPFAERSLPAKLWGVHGWFHPAVVHFPIALFTVGALFVLLNALFKGNFREIAFWCLLIGTLGAIASCTMGWSFAAEKSAAGDEVFWHRWGGIVVAGFSTLVTILALRLKSSDKGLSQIIWQSGLLLCAAMVGLVGHQGGELVYGEHMYERAIEKYFPSSKVETPAHTDVTPAPAEGASNDTTGDESTGSGETGTGDESSDTGSGEASADTSDANTGESDDESTDSPGTETPSTESTTDDAPGGTEETPATTTPTDPEAGSGDGDGDGGSP